MTAPAAMLRGVDRSAFAVSFALRLRAAGVQVGFTAIDDLVRAFGASPPITRERLYWMARICLVRRHTEIPAFDAVFAAVFADALLEVDPNARRKPLGAPTSAREENVGVPRATADAEPDSGLPWATLPPVIGPGDDAGETAITLFERLPAAIAGLVDAPFEQLAPDEMQLLGRWLQSAVRTWPTRRSRRTVAAADGHQIALRPTIAQARRTAWEPVELVYAKRVDKPRRVVMLCDVSQSMQAQATAYLHLMRALTLGASAEVFAFATSLTRLTAVLSHRSAEDAIALAGAKVTDRFGGTRIATNVQALLNSHHGDSVRGSIVIIGSDGWDSDSPERLRAAMTRLRRRAHRLIWINPRAAAPGFTPRVASMAAALPSCDALVPADTFASLAGVIDQIGRVTLSSRALRGSTGGTGRR